MKIISTKTHGFLDYLVGILLVISPALFNFSRGGAESWIPMIMGVSLLLMSALTRYELSLFNLISMPVHLGFDIASAFLLTLSPFIFGFHSYIMMPHIIMGLILLSTALMTDPHPNHIPAKHAHTPKKIKKDLR
ncbi:MAG: hypothetical protein SGI71_02505 [Verrucomicrobiota bacterium]|nr:hypothetical protein [Verrucomicrobiota bacterium]